LLPLVGAHGLIVKLKLRHYLVGRRDPGGYPLAALLGTDFGEALVDGLPQVLRQAIISGHVDALLDGEWVLRLSCVVDGTHG
jgi:hypothetical protein